MRDARQTFALRFRTEQPIPNFPVTIYEATFRDKLTNFLSEFRLGLWRRSEIWIKIQLIQVSSKGARRFAGYLPSAGGKSILATYVEANGWKLFDTICKTDLRVCR